MDRNKFKKRYTLKIGEKYYCSMQGDECKKQKSNPKDPLCCCSCEIKRQAYEKLAYYENMEEQGKLMILPCKPGDTVYVKMDDGGYKECTVIDFSYSRSNGFCIVIILGFYYKQSIPFTEFGKTVFLTDPEAQEALKDIERVNNG